MALPLKRAQVELRVGHCCASHHKYRLTAEFVYRAGLGAKRLSRLSQCEAILSMMLQLVNIAVINDFNVDDGAFKKAHSKGVALGLRLPLLGNPYVVHELAIRPTLSN
jgi:hypothetical protein